MVALLPTYVMPRREETLKSYKITVVHCFSFVKHPEDMASNPLLSRAVAQFSLSEVKGFVL